MDFQLDHSEYLEQGVLENSDESPSVGSIDTDGMDVESLPGESEKVNQGGHDN